MRAIPTAIQCIPAHHFFANSPHVLLANCANLHVFPRPSLTKQKAALFVLTSWSPFHPHNSSLLPPLSASFLEPCPRNVLGSSANYFPQSQPGLLRMFLIRQAKPSL